jgi:hypothetical protein
MGQNEGMVARSCFQDMDRGRRPGGLCLCLAVRPAGADLVEADDRDNHRSRMWPFAVPLGRPDRSHTRELWTVGPDHYCYRCVPHPDVGGDISAATGLACLQPSIRTIAAVISGRQAVDRCRLILGAVEIDVPSRLSAQASNRHPSTTCGGRWPGLSPGHDGNGEPKSTAGGIICRYRCY